jgi:hypothetical protein
MTEDTKDYLFKTLLAFALMGLGGWGVSMGGQGNIIFGAICFLIGFIILLVLYGEKWLWWW